MKALTYSGFASSKFFVQHKNEHLPRLVNNLDILTTSLNTLIKYPQEFTELYSSTCRLWGPDYVDELGELVLNNSDEIVEHYLGNAGLNNTPTPLVFKDKSAIFNGHKRRGDEDSHKISHVWIAILCKERSKAKLLIARENLATMSFMGYSLFQVLTIIKSQLLYDYAQTHKQEIFATLAQFLLTGPAYLRANIIKNLAHMQMLGLTIKDTDETLAAASYRLGKYQLCKQLLQAGACVNQHEAEVFHDFMQAPRAHEQDLIPELVDQPNLRSLPVFSANSTLLHTIARRRHSELLKHFYGVYCKFPDLLKVEVDGKIALYNIPTASLVYGEDSLSVFAEELFNKLKDDEPQIFLQYAQSFPKIAYLAFRRDADKAKHPRLYMQINTRLDLPCRFLSRFDMECFAKEHHCEDLLPPKPPATCQLLFSSCFPSFKGNNYVPYADSNVPVATVVSANDMAAGVDQRQSSPKIMMQNN